MEPAGIGGSLPSGSPTRGGSLSVLESARQQRVVSSPLDIQLGHDSPGSSGSHSLCLIDGGQVTKFNFAPASPSSECGGYPLESLAVQVSLWHFLQTCNLKVFPQIVEGAGRSGGNTPLLAKEATVPGHCISGPVDSSRFRFYLIFSLK